MTALLPDRRLMLFCGPETWGEKAVKKLIANSALCDDQIYWHQAEENALSILGQDRTIVVINAYHGLDPDIVGRTSGTIIAGGALLIICPQLDEWPAHADPQLKKLTPYSSVPKNSGSHYLRRWSKILTTLEGIEIHSPAGKTPVKPVIGETPKFALDKACTDDQAAAVEALIKTVTGQRRLPTIITADRGRGKSAAMGLAAAQLITLGKAQHIIVTSSGFNRVRSLFKHAHAALEDSDFNLPQKTLDHAQGRIRYVSADSLLAQRKEDAPDCDLLLVDEAATLGVSMLQELLLRFPRLAFASTEHGYEGSGRGFSLKFKQLIKEHCRGSRFFQLQSPVRWANQDPLEHWLKQLLLLNAKDTAFDSSKFTSIASLSFAPLSQQDLVKDEQLLHRVFQLLSDAHYQTRPVDLRHLLDAPNSHLWVARAEKHIIGLVWLMFEGELDEDISLDIVAGKRRPQGHLIPQILAAHLGLVDAARLRCARIQRIVVEPDLQNKGIGGWMLAQLKTHLAGTEDYLASSFGSNQQLVRFWNQAQFKPVRLSDKPNAASGLHSALVLHPLSDSASLLQRDAQSIFARQFIAQLAGSLRDLSPALACELGRDLALAHPLQATELETTFLFAYASRPYESSLAVAQKLAQTALFSPALETVLSTTMRHLFVMRSLQNRSWHHCAERLGLSGKAECVQLLRQGAQIIISEHCSLEAINELKEKYGLMAVRPYQNNTL